MKTVESKYTPKPYANTYGTATKYDAVPQEKPKPEQTFRAGGISASVWRNITKDGENEYPSITFERNYKDKDGSWKSTTSLRMNDLPKAAVVLAKAYEYLVLKGHNAPQVA